MYNINDVVLLSVYIHQSDWLLSHLSNELMKCFTSNFVGNSSSLSLDVAVNTIYLIVGHALYNSWHFDEMPGEV